VTGEPQGAPEPEQPKNDTQEDAASATPRADRPKPTSNPLGQEQRGLNNAFWRGQRFLSPEMSRHGPSVHIGHADIRDMQIGNRTQIFIGHSVSRTLGSIQEEDLVWVRSRYLEVPGYEGMAKILAERRVLLLRGQPGSGRSTTALHLLDRVASTRVLRVEGTRALSDPEKRDFPEENAGYVAELSRENAGAVTAEKLDKLRDVLAGQSAFCVLISESDTRDLDLFGGYAAAYTAPDPVSLLRKHTNEEVLANDPPDLEDRLADLLDTEWVAKALGPCARPMESVRMATLLAQHARGAATREEVEREAAEAVRFQISEWFEPLKALPAGAEHDEALYLTAFRVALAVLNESPYHLVAEAAAALGLMLIKASADGKARYASLFSDDQSSRLPALRATIVDGTTTFGPTRLPMRLLVFHDERYPVEILRYVWENHHRMAATVTTWLSELCSDSRPLVWVRAAQAAGFLGSLDFAQIFAKAIYPAILSIEDDEDVLRQHNLAAAVALDHAAQHEHLHAAIHDRLRTWRRSGGFGERYTAAATYGFVLGGEHIEESLEELRVLGTPSERQSALEDGDSGDHALVVVAGYSIAKLFAFGSSEVVLDHLLRWISGSRTSLRVLAQSAVRHLVSFHGFELDHLALAVGRDQPALPERMKMWPLLVSVHVRNPELTEPIAELLRQLLRREGDQAAKQFLGRWVRQSERNTALLAALADFIPHIVRSEADEYRLTYLLDRLSQDWAEPLRPDVANRLRQAILSNRVGSANA
jgi:hypothetical protein